MRDIHDLNMQDRDYYIDAAVARIVDRGHSGYFYYSSL